MENRVFVPSLVVLVITCLSLIMALVQSSSNTSGFVVVAYPNGTTLRFYAAPARIRQRPLVAGLQVVWNNVPTSLSYFARRSGIYGIVMCAHCINYVNGSVTIYQNVTSSNNIIANGIATSRAHYDSAFMPLNRNIDWYPWMLHINNNSMTRTFITAYGYKAHNLIEYTRERNAKPVECI